MWLRDRASEGAAGNNTMYNNAVKCLLFAHSGLTRPPNWTDFMHHPVNTLINKGSCDLTHYQGTHGWHKSSGRSVFRDWRSFLSLFTLLFNSCESKLCWLQWRWNNLGGDKEGRGDVGRHGEREDFGGNYFNLSLRHGAQVVQERTTLYKRVVGCECAQELCPSSRD